jgi:hypothetical protein
MPTTEDFINGVLQAQMVMTQRVLVEIARMKGAEGGDWIERYRNAVITELNDATTPDGQPRPAGVSQVSQSVVTNIAQMAKERWVSLRDEGGL